MKTYIKQNKIQREIMRLKNIFITNWDQINKVQDNGIEVYNIGPTRKEKFGVGMILFSLIVPATAAPITIPLIYKTMLGGRK